MAPDGPTVAQPDADPAGAAAARLERMLRDLPARDGRSGFALVESGRDALVTLYDLAATAERSLDLQSYLWRRDDAGRLLMLVLLDAADRRVRVRAPLAGGAAAWGGAIP